MIDNLPMGITPGSKALFHDPAGARARDGEEWIPVILTGIQGTFRDGSRWVEIQTSSGRGRDLAASDIKLQAT